MKITATTEEFMHGFGPSMAVSDATKWHNILMDLAPNEENESVHVDDMTFVYSVKGDEIHPLRFTLDSISKFDIEDARAEFAMSHHETIHTGFMPFWHEDNYGKMPHNGVAVPMGEDVEICQFVTHGYNFKVCGCVNYDNSVRVWAESSMRGEPFEAFEEDSFDDLGDVFDSIVMYLYDGGIDVQEDVKWLCDWCESQNYETGELGAGLFIQNRFCEYGFPYSCGFPGCNDPRQEDKNFDSEFDFENEIQKKDSDSRPVTINIYL